MTFKFRLEASLRLARQELDIVEGELARELRIRQNLIVQRDDQAKILSGAQTGQKRACLSEPQNLGIWQKYCLLQKQILADFEQKVREQEKIVSKYREKLLECRIKAEKFKRLKEKKLRLYQIEELKQEQKVIDEIAQSRGAGSHDGRIPGRLI
jgi:flagellar FliJ protein